MGFPKVSIIIPTYNRAKLLSATIDSFINLDYPQECCEIIVSDNGSTDDTGIIVDDYVAKYPHIKKIDEPRNGVHFARNSAAKISSGEILYFTDDDMVADPLLMKELVEVFSQNPLVASATGKIVGKFEVEPPRWVQRDLINGLLSLTENGRPEGVTVSNESMVYSCHQAVRRDAFFCCGGFNPENTAGVWVGDGESGLAIKFKKAGYKFAYNSRSLIYHVIPKTRMTLEYLLNRVGNQGYCDSYTEYRQHRSRYGIVTRLLKRNTYDLVRCMLRTIVNVVLERESWRFILARLTYYARRNSYDVKLLYNDKFRAMVEVDDWLDDRSSESWYVNVLMP